MKGKDKMKKKLQDKLLLYPCPVTYFRPNYYSLNKQILGVYGKTHDTI